MDELHQMFKFFQCLHKTCICHVQGECILVGSFKKPYLEQAVGDDLDVTYLIGGTEEQAAIQLVMRM
jgi:hypothetical protein